MRYNQFIRRSSEVTFLFVLLLLLPHCAKKKSEEGPKTFADYQQHVEETLAGKQHDDAMNYLAKMIEEYPDDQKIPQYRLALADLYLEEGKKNFDPDPLRAAFGLYKRFYQLNPSDEKAEYASYRAILSLMYQTNRGSWFSSKDSSEKYDTSLYRKIMKRCAKHLDTSIFKGGHYESDVKDIQYTCERKLLDKEVTVFNTYLRAGNFKSAESRLHWLRDEHFKYYRYQHVHPDLLPRVRFLECKLALRKKELDKAKEIAKELEQQNPDSEYTTMAFNAVDRRLNNPTFIF